MSGKSALEILLPIYAGIKYTVNVTRSGPNAFSLDLGGKAVDTVARKLNDGGLLIQVIVLMRERAVPALPLSMMPTSLGHQKECIT